MSKLNRIIFQLRKMICMHKFNLKDLKERNSDGNVTWSCFKCKKVFIAECGLDILKNGRCVVNNETFGGNNE